MLQSGDSSTGAGDTAETLTDCVPKEVGTLSYNISENLESRSTKQDDEDSGRLIQSLSIDSITFNFLTNLPLKVLEYIVGYLSVIDALIMCYTSPVVDEHVSMLHDAWKRKWSYNLHFTNDQLEYQRITNWKAECERSLALMMKLSNQAMLTIPENLCLRPCVTAMDYCDEMLLCFGEAHPRCSKEIFANVYQFAEQSWRFVITFPVPGPSFSITSCCLISGYRIFAGKKDGSLCVWNLEPSSQQVSLIRMIHAHTDPINIICPDRDLGIVATAGRDEILRFWNFETRMDELAYFLVPGITKIKIFTGEKSPFVGYNSVLITTYEKPAGYGVVMGCWGNDIPLREARFAHNVCHAKKYGRHGLSMNIIPDVFVQGGSLVYGLKLVDDYERVFYYLVWQPLDPGDFFRAYNGRKIDVSDHFCSSLHPRRSSGVIRLPERTLYILGVGKYFSVGVTTYKYDYSASITVTVNATGDTYKFSSFWTQSINEFHAPAKMVSSKWLDGLDHIQPGSICMILANSDGEYRIWTWRKDALVYNKLSASELRALPEVQRRCRKPLSHIYSFGSSRRNLFCVSKRNSLRLKY